MKLATADPVLKDVPIKLKYSACVLVHVEALVDSTAELQAKLAGI